MIKFRNTKMTTFALVILEVSSGHYQSAQLASWVVDKSHISDHLFRQKEDVFH